MRSLLSTPPLPEKRLINNATASFSMHACTVGKHLYRFLAMVFYHTQTNCTHFQQCHCIVYLHCILIAIVSIYISIFSPSCCSYLAVCLSRHLQCGCKFSLVLFHPFYSTDLIPCMYKIEHLFSINFCSQRCRLGNHLHSNWAWQLWGCTLTLCLHISHFLSLFTSRCSVFGDGWLWWNTKCDIQTSYVYCIPRETQTNHWNVSLGYKTHRNHQV